VPLPVEAPPAWDRWISCLGSRRSVVAKGGAPTDQVKPPADHLDRFANSRVRASTLLDERASPLVHTPE